jgi:hypothetical protein
MKYIVAVEMDAGSFAWLDALRREHFPPDRNLLPVYSDQAGPGDEHTVSLL